MSPRRASVLLLLPLLSFACGDGGESSGEDRLDGAADADGTRMDGASEPDVPQGAPDGRQDSSPAVDLVSPASDAFVRLDTAPAPDLRPADAAPACVPAGDCNPFMTNPCPAGQMCLPEGPNLRMRCAAAPQLPRAEGQSCGGAQVCGAGLVCLDSAGAGVCRRLCPRDSTGFCSADTRCRTNLIGSPCLSVCTPLPRRCNIYTQDCPDPGDACTLTSDPETGERFTGCLDTGTRGEGEPCTGGCGRGLICVSGDGASRCVQVCRPDGTPACPAGKTCTGRTTAHDVTFCKA